MLRWNFSIRMDQDLGFHMNYWNSWKKLHKILQKTLLYSFCSIVLNPVSCRVEWIKWEMYRIFRWNSVNKTFFLFLLFEFGWNPSLRLNWELLLLPKVLSKKIVQIFKSQKSQQCLICVVFRGKKDMHKNPTLWSLKMDF